MKKCRFLAAIMLGILLCAASTVYGAAGNILELPLAVSWGEGGLRPGTSYQLTLEATEEGTPMPEGSGDTYTMQLDETVKNTDLPGIVYQEPGDYWYILKLQRTDETVVDTYYIHVMAINEDNGNLSVTTSIHKNKINGMKTDQITFHDPGSGKNVTPQPTVTPESSGGKKKSTTPGENGKNSGSYDKNENMQEKAGKVKTGDETNVLFYLLTGCAALLCILTAEKRKQKR